MMQVEPLGSVDCVPVSMPVSETSHHVGQAASPINAPSTATEEPLNKEVLQSERITKQAITPITGKSSLLKFLKGTKAGVFKTIGDRIIVPIKGGKNPANLPAIENAKFPSVTIGDRIVVPMSVGKDTQSLPAAENSKFHPVSTFKMAVPATSNFQVKTFTTKPASVSKIIPLKANSQNKIIKRSPLTDMHVIVKTENLENGFVTNDLNKFMKSISKSTLSPLKREPHDDISLLSPPPTKSKPTIVPSRFKLDEQDEELTSLSWLSSNNKHLLDTIRKCNPDDPGIGLSGDESEGENVNKKLVFTAMSPINPQNFTAGQTYNDFKYNPLCKPPYSFSCLIFMAIEDSYLKRLPVRDIYRWVCKHFPYYRSAPSGWKNSIRHNLSLNRCFKKADCSKITAKASLWCIDPAYRPNLVQALKRSPYYPYLHPSGKGQPLSLNDLANLLPGAHSGVFPSWMPARPPPSTLWADRDMASAALNLMGLRGPDSETSNKAELISNTLEEIFRDADWLEEDRHRQRRDSSDSVGSVELIISGEPDDHCYALALPIKRRKKEEKRCKSPQSDKSAPDAAYEFESGALSDDFADDVIDDIMEDVTVEDEEEDQSLFDSGFGSMKSYVMKEQQDSSKKASTVKKSATAKRKSLRTNSKTKSATRCSNRYAVKSNIQSRSGSKKRKPPIKIINPVKKKPRKTSADKCSDVDSGKDSPKVVRTGRSRRLKQRTVKKYSSSKYHTRSSGFKLLGQREEDRKFLIRKRKRRRSVRHDATDDEEVKWAAGSLMCLAGLINSPTTPSKHG